MRWVRLTWKRFCAGCLLEIRAGEFAQDAGGIVVHGERCLHLHEQHYRTKTKLPPI